MTMLDDARRRDGKDPLARHAAAFDLPEGVIYLDGNSLGPPSRRALERLHRTAAVEWREGLIRSWNDADWIDLPKIAGAKIARLIGAEAGDVIVADSVSVNLYKLAGALALRRPGARLCVEESEFPTDQYVLEGLARQTGAALLRVAAGETPENAIIVRSLVHYRSADIRDMREGERAAAARSSVIIWDLSHATGLIPVDMRGAGAAFAVGCGYKYLNGGPGAPAFIHVARAMADRLQQPISGWMGAAAPFSFNAHYAPAEGAARFASGTPAIVSLAALDAALDLFEGVDLAQSAEKSRALGDFFLACLEGTGLTPAFAPARRGGHISIRHADGQAIVRALIARGVIGDFRAPDMMRFGFAPLYLSFEAVFRAAETMTEILASGEWRRAEYSRPARVT